MSIAGVDPATTACVPAWDSNTPYTLNAIHAALIAKGPKRGCLFVFGDPYIQAFAYSLPPKPLPPTQRQIHWAILDPAARTADDFCANLPSGMGDLFCAGIAQDATGNVLVVGGSDCHEFVPACNGQFTGSVLAFRWEPPTSSSPTDGGTWIRLDDLDQARWYPTITTLGPEPVSDEDWAMVSGGTNPGPNPQNALRSYQVLRSTQQTGQQWQPSTLAPPLDHTFPDAGGNFMPLENYPRGILLPGVGNSPNELARVVFAGYPELTDRVSHYLIPGGLPGAWQQDLSWKMAAYREYGSALLLSLAVGTDNPTVLACGGLSASATILGSIQTSRANLGPTARNWVTDSVSLLQPRWLLNTVAMPDTRVFIAGGEAGPGGFTQFEGCSQNPSKTPEIYDRTQTDPARRLRPAAEHLRIHDYHSTMLLLPSGEIALCGGESRHRVPCTPCPCPNGETEFPADYEIYQPDYITNPAPGSPVFHRPIIQPPPLPDPLPPNRYAEFVLAYGQQADVYYTMPSGADAVISKVVLVRPGAVTHHADVNQRCVELNFARLVNEQTGQTFVRVDVPSKLSGFLPRGIYMLFLVSSQNVVTQGVPSVAAWAQVQ